MNNSFILIIGLLLATATCMAQQPPYSGTIFIDPDIITPTDSSAYQSVTYTGQGMRTVYDRRVSNWVTINAYLFDVVWNDGLTSEAQINPEFGSVAAATVEAEKYAWSIGQLPTCLRVDVDEIWIHLGTEPFGGGNNSILIHTGQSTIYEADGILEETLVHEACHTSLDARHAASAGWLNAQNLDPTFISTYARDHPTREDIAESFLTWLMVRHRRDSISQQDYDAITMAIPNRLAYFDSIPCDLFPMVISSGTSIDKPKDLALFIYPNPTQGMIHIEGHGIVDGTVRIWDTTGKLAYHRPLSAHGQVDLAHLPNGLYLIELRSEAGSVKQKVIKR